MSLAGLKKSLSIDLRNSFHRLLSFLFAGLFDNLLGVTGWYGRRYKERIDIYWLSGNL